MKNLLSSKWLLLLVFAIALIMLIAWWQAHPEDKQITNLPVGEVKREDLVQRVTISGKIIPERQTIITAPYNGYVKEVFVKVGDEVASNDPIVSVVKSLQTSEKVYPLRAPYAGKVMQVQKSEGEFVKAFDTDQFIVEIDDVSKMYINGEIPEVDIDKVKVGQQATIKATPILDQTYQGVIREISLSPKVQAQSYGGWGSRSQTIYPVRIEILDKNQRLRPGMTTIVDVITAKKENVLTLGHEFIHKSGEDYYVILASGEKQPISIGLQNEQQAEIVTGLTEGMRVRQVDFMQLSSGEKANGRQRSRKH
jgi:multidrug efflux pump subunit AcrA (membrane-fusion protein)